MPYERLARFSRGSALLVSAACVRGQTQVDLRTQSKSIDLIRRECNQAHGHGQPAAGHVRRRPDVFSAQGAAWRESLCVRGVEPVEPPERLFAVAVLEVSYIGTRGTHLVRERSLNQALSASANNPIRGLNAPTPSCARVGTSYCRMRSTECAKNEKSTGAPRLWKRS